MAMFDCFCGPGLYKLGLFLYICFMKKQLNVILLALAAFAMPTVVCASHNYETCANAPPKQENEVFKIDNTICFEVKNDYCYEVTPFVLNAQQVITETILQPLPTLAESKPHYYNSFIKLVTWPDSKRMTWSN